MKTYKVKEVAKMLNTSEETVRRWIRSGKLVANMDSRKGGSIITDSMLKAFVKNTPKYAAALATPAGGIVTASTLLLGSLVAKEISKSEALNTASVSAAEVEKLLKSDLARAKSNVKNKQGAIAQLKKEIHDEEARIKNIEYLLRSIDKQKEN